MIFIKKRNRKIFSAVVVKKSSNKTVKVVMKRKYKYFKYNKIVFFDKYYLVHDEKNISNVGDKVTFVFSRKVSKRKHAILLNVVK